MFILRISMIINSGNNKFRKRIKTGYVDKTGLIAYLNKKIGTDDAFYCVTRPRRFGKTIAASALCAYLCKDCDSKDLFDGLEISHSPSYLKHLNKYDVIFLDMQDFESEIGDGNSYIANLNASMVQELKQAYPKAFVKLEERNEESIDFPKAVRLVHQEYGIEFVFILDEWDYVFRTFPNNENLHNSYLSILRQLFKETSGEECVALAYMTGILPIKRLKGQTALNNFKDISMLNTFGLGKYTGFTETDVKEICKNNDLDYEKVKLWYGGYNLDGIELYNPYSIEYLTESKVFKGYWSKTASTEVVEECIAYNLNGIKNAFADLIEVVSISNVNVDDFNNDFCPSSSRDAVLVYLVHLGYLSFDKKDNSVRIPNLEVKNEIKSALLKSRNPKVLGIIKKSQDFVDHILNLESESVAEEVEEIHQEYCSTIRYNSEQSLQSVLQVALLSSIEYYDKVKLEEPTGKGFADMVLFPQNGYQNDYPVVVIELKWNKDAKTAIDQIKERNYFNSFKDKSFGGLLVGINYNPKTKVHDCIIESIDFEK